METLTTNFAPIATLAGLQIKSKCFFRGISGLQFLKIRSQRTDIVYSDIACPVVHTRINSESQSEVGGHRCQRVSMSMSRFFKNFVSMSTSTSRFFKNFMSTSTSRFFKNFVSMSTSRSFKNFVSMSVSRFFFQIFYVNVDVRVMFSQKIRNRVTIFIK